MKTAGEFINRMETFVKLWRLGYQLYHADISNRSDYLDTNQGYLTGLIDPYQPEEPSQELAGPIPKRSHRCAQNLLQYVNNATEKVKRLMVDDYRLLLGMIRCSVAHCNVWGTEINEYPLEGARKSFLNYQLKLAGRMFGLLDKAGLDSNEMEGRFVNELNFSLSTAEAESGMALSATDFHKKFYNKD